MKPVQAKLSDTCGLTRPDLVMHCFAALLLNFVQHMMSTYAVSHQPFKPVLGPQALTKSVPKSTYAVATWLTLLLLSHLQGAWKTALVFC